jgi:2'-5' RNA ligase
MVWVTLDDPSGLAASLSSTVGHEAGLPAEGRAFRAHVTLVRARSPRAVDPRAIEAACAPLSDSGRLADRTVSVRSATVFSSTLGGTGPAYEPLALLALGAIADDGDAR